MARLIGPGEASREAKVIVGNTFQAKRNRPVNVYSDAAATLLADILTIGGTPIAGSAVTTDAYSMLPLIQFPDGVDTLWVVVDGGPAWPIYARDDDRHDAAKAALDALGTRLADAETVAAAAETPSGAQAKANAAQAAAVTDAGNKVTAHVAATDPHGDRAYTDTELAGRVPASRQITAGTGLSGGGDLSANRTLAVAFGTTAGTAAQGNDSQIRGAQPRLIPSAFNPLESGAAADYTGRYGTTGTGTDSRAGIQAALNAASDVSDPSYYGYLARRSTTVRLPPGHYLISAPASGPSLNVPAGVVLDTTDATLYFDYPAAARKDWCGIQVNQYGQLRVGKLWTSGRNAAPDAALAYDAVRLVMTDNNSRVIGYGDSEIRGFQGAGVRLVGAWISYIKGIRFTSLKYGIVASNRGDGTLGYALPAGNPSGSRRVVTDTRVEDCQFVNISNGGFVGTVSGNVADINAVDNTDSGLTLSLIGCVFESIGTFGLQVNNALTVTLVDCGLEEIGTTEAMVWVDNVRSFMAANTRVNLAGRSVPGPSGTNVTPFPGAVFKVTSVQTLTVEGLYCHNNFNAALTVATAAATIAYRLAGVYTDVNPFTPGAMYAGIGVASSSATWDKGHPAFGSQHLWVDSAGTLRHKAGAPTSDLDGVALPAGGALGCPLLAGLYYTPPAGQLTTNTPSEANELAVPLLVGRTCTLLSVAASVTTAGSTGALLRLGVRANNAGQPGSVLADAGTVAAETTGVKELAISVPVVEGTIVWLTVTVQGAATTRPTIQGATGAHDLRVGSTSVSTLLSATSALYQSGAGSTTGALPGSQTWSLASTAPRIAVKS